MNKFILSTLGLSLITTMSMIACGGSQNSPESSLTTRMPAATIASFFEPVTPGPTEIIIVNPTAEATPTRTLITLEAIENAPEQTPTVVRTQEAEITPDIQNSQSPGVESCPEDMIWLPNAPVCLDRNEVTNQLYAECVEANVCKPPVFTRSLTRPSYFGDPEFAQFPVIHVNWSQAVSYCTFRGKRLPSEAEWDAGFEDNLASLDFDLITNPIDTRPVGEQIADQTARGINDLAGNVREWVADAIGISRIVKGRGFASTQGEIGHYLESASDWMIGFRCAQNILQ